MWRITWFSLTKKCDVIQGQSALGRGSAGQQQEVLETGKIRAFHFNWCLWHLFKPPRDYHCAQQGLFGALITWWGEGRCLFWALANHSPAGNDKPPIQSSSSSCSQTRLLGVCSAQPDPGNYSVVSGISHIFKKGGKKTSHVLMHSLQPRMYLCFRLHKVSKILPFLEHRSFWCVFH